MRGLIASILSGGAHARPADPLDQCRAEIAEAVARRAAERLARPAAGEAKRFARARPMVEQLTSEIAARREQANRAPQ